MDALGRLWSNVCATGGLSMADLCALSAASRGFSELVRGPALNYAWQELAVARWPTLQRGAKIRSWYTLAKRRETVSRRLAPVTVHPIEGCDAELECPVMLESMVPDSLVPWWSLKEIHCRVCDRNVRMVESQEELQDAVAEGMCVSFFDMSRRGNKGGIRLSPPAPDGERIVAQGQQPDLTVTLVGEPGCGRKSFIKHLVMQSSHGWGFELLSPVGLETGNAAISMTNGNYSLNLVIRVVDLDEYLAAKEALLSVVRASPSYDAQSLGQAVELDRETREKAEVISNCPALSGLATIFCYSTLDDRAPMRHAALVREHHDQVSWTLQTLCGLRIRRSAAVMLATKTDLRGRNALSRTYYGHASERNCAAAAKAHRVLGFEAASPPPPLPATYRSVHSTIVTSIAEMLLPKGGRRGGCMVV